jgi:hypothetical protein
LLPCHFGGPVGGIATLWIQVEGDDPFILDHEETCGMSHRLGALRVTAPGDGRSLPGSDN